MQDVLDKEGIKADVSSETSSSGVITLSVRGREERHYANIDLELSVLDGPRFLGAIGRGLIAMEKFQRGT
jgi:hypothetical protein